MYRVRRNKNLWRTRWPFRIWWPPKMDERFCSQCSLPYINGPQPQEIEQFCAGNVAAILFPSGDWKRERCSIRFGRWRPSAGKWFFSEFIPDEEFDDLEQVIVQVRDYFAERAVRKNQRRFAAGEKTRPQDVSSPPTISRKRSH